jgi:protein-disulfide isomerase
MKTLLMAAMVAVPVAQAQFVKPAAVDHFNKKYVGKLKPPPGQKVAVIVFEDLGCPSCAANHATELKAVEQTHVPLVRYDFPFKQHVWTYEGAVCARYIQDNISPKLAADFRTDVFAAQRLISTPDDIDKFLRSWLPKHGQKAPFVIDPSGKLAKEVGEDLQFGTELNIEYTPTIIVATKDQYQVVFGTKDGPNDATKLVGVIQAAQASGPAPVTAAKKPGAAAKK